MAEEDAADDAAATLRVAALVRAEMAAVLDGGVDCLEGTRPIARVPVGQATHARSRAEDFAQQQPHQQPQPHIVVGGTAGWEAASWTAAETFARARAPAAAEEEDGGGGGHAGHTYGDAEFLVHSSAEDAAPMTVATFWEDHCCDRDRVDGGGGDGIDNDSDVEEKDETTPSTCNDDYDWKEIENEEKNGNRPRRRRQRYTYDPAGTTDPLYLFETLTGGDGDEEEGPPNPSRYHHARLLDSYSDPIPPHLDLLRFAAPGSRPGYRWLLLGGRGSGTKLHVDPFGTSAWNALLFGAKRWVLLPPDAELPKGWVEGPAAELADRCRAHGGAGVCDATVTATATAGERAAADGTSGASGWFGHLLPRYRDASEELPEHLRPISCVQRPGEIIYVPAGWHHAVINLEPSAALTANYADPQNFVAVRAGLFGNLWGSLEHLEAADEWHAAVRRAHPGLVGRHGPGPGRCVLCDAATAQRIRLLDAGNGGRAVCRPCAESTAASHGVLSAADADRCLGLSQADGHLRQLPSLWWHAKDQAQQQQYFMRAHLHELAEEVHGSVREARALARAFRGAPAADDETDAADDAEEEVLCLRYVKGGVFEMQ